MGPISVKVTYAVDAEYEAGGSFTFSDQGEEESRTTFLNWARAINRGHTYRMAGKQDATLIEMRNVAYIVCKKDLPISDAHIDSTKAIVTFSLHKADDLVIECLVSNNILGDQAAFCLATLGKCQEVGKRALIFSTEEQTVIVNRRFLLHINARV